MFKRFLAVATLCGATMLDLSAQTLTTLWSFNNGTDDNSSFPYAALIQGTNGYLYGTTVYGGPGSGGSVFKISTAGALSILYGFTEGELTSGDHPYDSLLLGTNGDFYGTTAYAGANDAGSVFKLTPKGDLTYLYNFCSESACADGQTPLGGLVQATNGDFYGATYAGGANHDGTVFKITPAGVFTVLYSFCAVSACTDGSEPKSALIQATNGKLYGTTYVGGTHDGGEVYQVTLTGLLTTVASLCGGCATGEGNPVAGVTQGADGKLYGTTTAGGTCGDGTVFKTTLGGTLTLLHSFCGADGANPYGGVIQATDGDFYGTTEVGGTYNQGSVFRITAGGTLTTLHSFCAVSGCPDGASPYAALFQATDGNLYGTTAEGGATSGGTVFRVSLDLPPFVIAVPSSGKTSSAVRILGSDLTGATSVTFNGVSAVFTVDSATEITATVPAGAKTGTVEVVTPTGALLSNVPFQVP